MIFIFKGALLMGRYGITAAGSGCEQNATDNNASDVSHGYIFTTIIYGIISVLRFVEYVVLGKQFHFFLFKQEDITFSHTVIDFGGYLTVFSILSLPYFVLGFTIPALGIYQEIEYSNRLKCYRAYREVYITYCIVNVFRYLLAYSVRFIMIFATLVLRKHWTQLRNQKSPEDLGNHTGYDSLVSEGELTMNRQEKVLQDWREVSSDFREHFREYAHIGKKIKVINELFQTWFIIPWAIYFIASSLKTYDILRPWDSDIDNIPPSNIPRFYYLLFSIDQLIALFIPYLCAQKINSYHQNYYREMTNRQLSMDDPSHLSFARQLLIEREVGYDFIPRIVGTSITISIGNPLYIIFLLVGLFLSVTESLLQ